MNGLPPDPYRDALLLGYLLHCGRPLSDAECDTRDRLIRERNARNAPRQAPAGEAPA